MIVFIDESGLSERPCRARTWAPRGETPVYNAAGAERAWGKLLALYAAALA